MVLVRVVGGGRDSQAEGAQLAGDPLVAQRGFSRASRSTALPSVCVCGASE
jgi:hypothetical protein